MDEAQALKAEWLRKQVQPVLVDLYHDIWVYGLAQMGNPVEGLGLPESVKAKMTYTGYLHRELPGDRNWLAPVDIESPYMLVTAGGGGDGEELIDWVIQAYESDRSLQQRAVIVTGPFMSPTAQQAFHERCENIEHLEIIEFDNHIELLMQKAIGIVAMGGYNTFCEILSFDKRALIVPRSVPRREQLIRAQRATALGLVTMLEENEACNPETMAKALKHLPEQLPPSAHAVEGLLDGHACIGKIVQQYLDADEPGDQLAAD
jgi:predicted glycosyltransferase